MTRPDLIAAVLADPEAVREVVEALRSGRVKVAGPWVWNVRPRLGTTKPAACIFDTMSGWRCCVAGANDFYVTGPESEALREIDTRLRAAGWLLCGEGE
jgi:hypothetical protein